ncbi:hypothetical protein EV681_0017 [Advenella incenata]|uniref:Uncharacterized protein n=1 Tax=Advenella incenata TaxID=267800 RepID=A0A4Q7VP98_9BURK|nr:hypothetical protein EV681_0017 [Advenella incenata]
MMLSAQIRIGKAKGEGKHKVRQADQIMHDKIIQLRSKKKEWVLQIQQDSWEYLLRTIIRVNKQVS